MRRRAASAVEGSAAAARRDSSQIDAQARQRFAQDVVLRVARPSFAEYAARLLGLADAPEHLPEMGRDLRVGTRLVGAPEQADRLLAVAEAVFDPSHAV